VVALSYHRKELQKIAVPCTVNIDEIKPVKGQNFSLHYDYGDDWMFTIHVQKIEEESRKKPPTLLKAVGSVEQYPDWDEWDDEEDEDE
jgi:hypothetical protein